MTIDKFDRRTQIAAAGGVIAIVAVIVIIIILLSGGDENSSTDSLVGVADSYSVDEDMTLDVEQPGVLSNDTGDGDASLAALLVTDVSNGFLTLNENGSFSYVPDRDFNGTDSFDYAVSDGTDSSSSVSVDILVNPLNDAPVGVPDSFDVGEDSTFEIEKNELLANDLDVDGDSISISNFTQPANGTVIDNSDGTLTYEPNAGFTGDDVFTYSITDGSVESVGTRVTLTVALPAVSQGRLVIDLLDSSDSGNSSTDNITSDSTPSVQVKAFESDVVNLFLNGELIETQSGVVDPLFTLPNVADGIHVVSAALEGEFGEPQETYVTELVIDTSPPSVSLASPARQGSIDPLTLLTGAIDGTGSDPFSLTYQLDTLPPVTVPVSSGSGLFSSGFDLDSSSDGSATLSLNAVDVAGNSTNLTLDVSVSTTTPFRVTSNTPTDGGSDVGITFRPQVFFSTPVDPTTINVSNFFATAGGQNLPANIVMSREGNYAWLFFTDDAPMPGGTAVEVTLDGSTILPASGGDALDADGDGRPGGSLQYSFSTVSTEGLPNTSLTGIITDPGPDLEPFTSDDVQAGPDGVLHTADDVFLLPIEGVTVHVIGQSQNTVKTAADGTYTLDSVPGGDIKLVVDGLTVQNPPAGFYFPEMVMNVPVTRGQVNFAMPGMREMYLPRIADVILNTVQSNTGMKIIADEDSAPELSSSQRDLLTLDVQPGSLIGPDGAPISSAQIGISTVPPELVVDMLPPGVLQHTFDITVQALGVTNFSIPAPMSFPNVFDSPPGTKLNFLSFDHTTGQLVIEGTGTVTADGQSVTTDPGTGITRPGWHGLTPPGSCGGSGGRPPDAPAPDPSETVTINPPSNLNFVTSSTGSFNFGGKTWRSPAPVPGTSPPPPPTGCGIPQQPESGPQTPFVSVFIKIDGPMNLFTKKSDAGDLPLQSQAFTLLPGSAEIKKFNFLARTYREMFGATELKNLTRDQLYGTEIEITEIVGDAEGNRTRTISTFRAFRWISVVNAFNVNDQSGTDAAFFRTFVDGNGGFKRGKFVKGHLPGSTDTTFSTADATFTVDGEPARGSRSVLWLFDPISDGLKTAPVQIKYDESVVGTVIARGRATAPVKIDINKAGYSEELQDVILSLKQSHFGGADGKPGVAGVDDDGVGGIDNPSEYGWAGSDDFTRVAYPHVEAAIKDTFNVGPDGKPGDAGVDDDGENGVDDIGELGFFLSDDEEISYVDPALRNQARVAGAKFQAAFAGFMPSDILAAENSDDIDDLLNLFNDLKTKADAEATLLEAAVLNDFQTANAGATGYVVTAAGATVTMTWAELGPGLFGSADFDANDDLLKIGLGAARLGEAQKQWLLTEILNRSVINDGRFAVGININWTSGATFAQYMANTVSHEISHTFGLNDSYLTRGGNINPTNDIMRAGGAADGNLTFATQNANLLRAAVGSQQNGDLPLTAELLLYRRNINLPGSAAGVRDEVGIIAPGIGIKANGSDLIPDVMVELGDIGVDGSGGSLSTTDFLISSVDQLPLTISSVSLADTTNGMSITNSIAPNTVLAVGESAVVTVQFDPQKIGPAENVLTITSDAGGAPVFTVSLEASGISAAPVAIVELVGNNNLGGAAQSDSVAGSPEIFMISNGGAAPLQITGIDGGLLTLTNVPSDITTVPVTLAFGESFVFGVDEVNVEMGLNLLPITVKTNDPANLVLSLGVTSTGFEIVPIVGWGSDFIAIETPNAPGAIILRNVSDDGGNFEFFLPALADYRLSIFDPETGLVAHGFGTTPVSGQAFDLTGSLMFGASIEPDSDFDGLPDDVELAVGTSATNPDTDGDGILDGVEVSRGLDPFGGLAFPTGVVGSLALTGSAREVVVESVGETELAAYVATGDAGLSIVDVSQFDSPILLGSLDLEGANNDVSVDPGREIAAVTGGASGLHLVDISDPMKPTLTRTVELDDGAAFVEIFDGAAYVASGSQLVAIDLVNGDVIESITPSGSVITDINRESVTFFTMDSSRTIRAIDVSAFGMLPLGSLTLPSADGAGTIVAGNGVVYAAAQPNRQGGFATIDASDARNLKLISGSVSPGVAELPNTDIAVNGTGLTLLLGSTTAGNTIDLVSSDDLAITDAFITRFALPASPVSVHIASGIAFVANGTAGLQIVNYLPFDNGGIAPETVLTSVVPDIDSGTPGVQVIEGTSVPVKVTVTDDFQVQRLDLLINGAVAFTDFSFPFDFIGIAPGATANDPSATLQVRAFDTGGNVSLSNELLLDLVPDTFPPSIERITPANGSQAGQGLTRLSISFDEPISVESLSSENFELTNGSGNTIPAQDIEFRNGDRTVLLTYSPLPVGDFTITVSGSGITDRVGNSLGSTDITSQFVIVEATISWIGGSGSWNDPTHWDTGVIPGPTDVVFIAGESGSITVTHDGGNTVVQSLNSQETLDISGGTLSYTQPSVVKDLLLSGGSLSGPSNLTVAGSMVWTRGTLNGEGTLTIPAGVTLEVSGNSNKALRDHTLDNFGTVVWSGKGDIQTGNGGVFNNNVGALFDVQNDEGLSYNLGGAAPTFNNFGTLRKSIGTGTTTFNVDLQSSGLIDIDSGTLQIARSGSSSGVFDTAEGAVLRFAVNYTANDGSSFTGDGLVDISNGVFSVGTGASITAINLQLDGGTISGPGDLQIDAAGSMVWTRGTLSGEGTLTIPAGVTLEVSGNSNKALRDYTLDNFGTVVWSGSGDIFNGNGGVFNNNVGALFDVQNDEGFTYNLGGAAPTFNNFGTLRKSIGTGTTTFNVDLQSSGLIDIDSGTIQIARSGSSSGVFDTAEGAVLRFAVNYTVNDGSSFTGDGLVDISNGVFSVGTGASITAINLQLDGGTISGPGDLQIDPAGSMVWTRGTLSGGGTLTIPVGVTLEVSGNSNKALRDYTLDNFGTVVWSGSGDIFNGNGGVFNNNVGALFDVQNDEGFTYNLGGAAPTFNNFGTIRKSIGTGTTTFNVDLQSSGLIDIDSGTIQIARSGSSSGVFDTAEGAVLRFAVNYTVNVGSSFTGDGLVDISNGVFTVGTGASITAINLQLSGGTISGPGDLQIDPAGSMVWTRGTLSGGGTLTIPVGVTLEVSGNSNKALRDYTLDNFGTVVWTGAGDIFTGNGGVFNNNVGALFDVQNDESYTYNLGGAAPTFNNSGTVRKSAGTGTTTFSVDFDNSGNSGTPNCSNSIDAITGTFDFTRDLIACAP